MPVRLNPVVVVPLVRLAQETSRLFTTHEITYMEHTSAHNTNVAQFC